MPVLAFLVLIWVAGCSAERPSPVVVGAEETTAGRIGGELLAQALARRGVAVRRRFDVGGPTALHEALRAGEVDVAVGYTGLTLFEILGEPPERDPSAAFAAVQGATRPMGLEWLPRLGWDDRWVVLVRPQAAGPRHLTALDGLGAFANQLRAAIPTDLLDRHDGFPALASQYGLSFSQTMRVLPGAAYEVLAKGRADLGVGRATDARIARDGLVVLSDGLRWFPPFEAAPVVRRTVLSRQPRVRAALLALAGRVTIQAMRRATAQVEQRARTPAEAARALLGPAP